MSAVHVVVVSTGLSAALTRASVRSALAADASLRIHVLDVDGHYVPVGSESVLTLSDAGLRAERVHRAAVCLEPTALVRSLYPSLVRAALDEAKPPATVIALESGVLLLHRPTSMIDAALESGLCLVARAPYAIPTDGLWPSTGDVALAGAYSGRLIVLRGAQAELLDLWESEPGWSDTQDVPGSGDRWLEIAAGRFTHHTIRDPAALLSPWNLTPRHVLEASTRGAGSDGLLLDGRDVVAVDLSALNPKNPLLLDATAPRDPRGRLSDHPALARLVQNMAPELAAEQPAQQGDSWDLTTTSIGTPVDTPLRALYRSASARRPTVPAVRAPDPFDPRVAGEFRSWLVDPALDGGPGRYLQAVHRTRADLRSTFPRVPGEHTAGFVAWVRAHGAQEYAPAMIDLALSPLARTKAKATGRPGPGVNVVGYLSGELGIGESARLMLGALGAADVPHTTVPVDGGSLSRQNATVTELAGRIGSEVFDTSLICVNADFTPSVAATIPELLARTYRIGMWYWEVEEFPVRQHAGFAHVDEVWVATDFIRGAIEPHSPVPVRTITPPLPQRGTEPSMTRADLGLPERKLFLFSFDFLSTVERKNPLGLIDAFTAAFSPGEGPVLVIKSINGIRRPADAERLRLRAATAPDVVLLEDYLDVAERDALVALSDCYVSLHRSEGLGLTMAEAMAWGKPVIATGYSGNTQFMTEENSFLVPWTPTEIPAGAEPYPAGGIWADPDLDVAARLMRSVLEDPVVAAERGARAAIDIATLHNPVVAGRRITARLAETAGERRGHSRIAVSERLRATARAAKRSIAR